MENLISRQPPSSTPSTLIIGSIHYPLRKIKTKQWYNLVRYLSPVYAKRVNQKIIYPTYLFVDYTALNGKQKRLAKYPIQNQPSKHAEVIPQAHERIVQEMAILLLARIKVSATQVWPIINQNYMHPTSLGGLRIALRNVLTEQLIANLIKEANQLVTELKDDKS